MQLLPRLDRHLHRPAAGGNLKVSPFDLHRDRPTTTVRFLAPGPDILSHRDHAGLDLNGINQVLRESRLGSRRLSVSVRLNEPVVLTLRDVVVPTPRPCRSAAVERKGFAVASLPRLDPERAHLDRRLWTDAVELRHRQGCNKGLRLVRHDRELAVWLAIVRRDLGEELVAGNSRRGREPGFLVDARPDFLRGLPRRRDASEIVGDVEIGFVERERFDQRGAILEDRLNLLGHPAVNVEPWRDKHEFRALPNCDS